MEPIEATYRVTTPMFCGGADPSGTAELRLASFKGVLRFWWRALAWERCSGNIESIQHTEDELFGSAGGGQSHVVMRLNGPPPLAKWNKDRLSPGLAYLAGQGLAERGRLTRAAVAPGFDFAVLFRLRPQVEERLQDLLRDALIAMGLVGGLGARSRRGFGSLTLESLTGLGEAWHSPQNLADLRDELNRFGKKGDYPPPYTAFSRETQLVVVPSRNNEASETLLDRLGTMFLTYRTREGKFSDDGQAVRDYLERNQAHQNAPRRVIFGLPHNYFFKHSGRTVEIAPAQHDRRASPLFFHVHETSGSPPIGVIALLKSEFLPEGERIELSGGGGNSRVSPLTGDKLWAPAEAFLRLLEQHAGATRV